MAAPERPPLAAQGLAAAPATSMRGPPFKAMSLAAIWARRRVSPETVVTAASSICG